jgi:hypothetical protein
MVPTCWAYFLARGLVDVAIRNILIGGTLFAVGWCVYALVRNLRLAAHVRAVSETEPVPMLLSIHELHGAHHRRSRFLTLVSDELPPRQTTFSDLHSTVIRTSWSMLPQDQTPVLVQGAEGAGPFIVRREDLPELLVLDPVGGSEPLVSRTR